MGDYSEFLPDTGQSDGPPEADFSTSAGDVIDQAGNRLKEGVLDLPGIVGDVDSMARDVGTWLARSGTYLLSGQKAADKIQPPARVTEGILPTSSEFKQSVGFQRRKPTTSAGKSFDEGILGDIAEGAPGVLVSGPRKILEGGLRRVIPEATKAVVKYDVAPRTVGSGVDKATEFAGLPEDWRTAARTVAEIGTAGVAGARELPNLAAQTRQQIRKQAGTAIDKAKQLGVSFQRPAIQVLASDIDQTIRSMGFNKKIHPQTWALVREIKKQASGGAPMDFTEYNTLRELATDAMGSAKGGDLKRAGRVTRILDKFMADPPPGTFTGDPKTAAALSRQMRDLWSRQHKVRIVEKALERVKNADPSSSEDAATRSAFRAIANNEDLLKQFSPQEQRAIHEVVRAGRFEKMTKWLAKWSLMSAPLRGMALGYMGHTLGGTEGALAALAGPEAAREGVNAITRRSAQKVNTMVRRGNNVNINMWPGVKPAIRTGAYLAGEPERKRAKLDQSWILVDDNGNTLRTAKIPSGEMPPPVGSNNIHLVWRRADTNPYAEFLP